MISRYPPALLVHLSLALCASGAAGCSRKGGDGEAPGRSFDRAAARAAAAAPFDAARPEGAFFLDADEAARRLGSFEWTAGVEWSVARQGSAERLRAVERHRLVQAANGEFALESEIDPGLGDGSQSGREVIWSGKTTYARGRWAPWRERPTDRGRDAKRFRGESYGMATDLALLLGPRFAIAEGGEATALGRSALRYVLSLSPDAPEAHAPADTRTFPTNGPDADTKVRLTFLDGAQAVSAKGELLLDAQTGVPLRLVLDAAFGVKADPRARIQVALRTQVKGLGQAVPAVAPPKEPLPDARRLRAVADALERAGLKKRTDGDTKKKEPGEETE